METLATGLLSTVVFGGKASSVVSAIGTDLVINTISTTTTSIGCMIKYLTTSNQPGIDEIINTLNNTDLDFTIIIIDHLVKEQSGKNLNESVKMALIGVNEILELIHKELDTIKKAIEYHKTKYFNTWRGFSWSGNLNLIKQHNDILKNRYQMLLELLKIYNYK
jgi:hypothetical protein